MSGETDTAPRVTARAGVLLLGGVLLICGALRVVSMARAQGAAPDGAIYIAQGMELTSDPGNAVGHYVYHPGYPALVGATGRILGAQTRMEWIFAARVVSFVMSLLAVGALYGVASQLIPRGPALISAALFGMGKEFVEYGSDAVSDPAALALALGALATILAAGKRLAAGRKWSVGLASISGALLGLAYLVRPEMLALGPVLAVAGTASGRGGIRRHRGLLAASVGVFVLALAVTAGPYMWAIGGLSRKKDLGDLVLSGTCLPLASLASTATAGLFPAILRVLDRFRQATGNVATFLVLVTLATWIGFYALRLSLPRRVVYRPGVLMPVVIFSTLLIWVLLLLGLEINLQAGYISTRHALGPAALLAILAGPGVYTIAQWIVHLRLRLGFRPLQGATILICAALAGVLAALASLTSIAHEGKSGFRQVAQEADADPKAYWLSFEVLLAYYGGCPVEQLRQIGQDSCKLHPEHMVSVEALLARAESNRHPVRFFAVPQVLPADGQAIPIGRMLGDDPRFELVSQRTVGEQIVCVFEFSSP